MSDATDALLLKVIGGLEQVTARLDALEARDGAPAAVSVPEESFPEWDEYGNLPAPQPTVTLTLVPDPPEAPSGAETATPAPRALSPTQAAAQFQVPADPALAGGIKGDGGTMIRPPTSDIPIVAGAGPGMGSMTPEQLDRCYQREVVAQRRARPIEDAAPRGA